MLYLIQKYTMDRGVPNEQSKDNRGRLVFNFQTALDKQEKS